MTAAFSPKPPEAVWRTTGLVRRIAPFVFVLFASIAGCGGARLVARSASASPAWQPLTNAVFESARERQALVLLSLQADWCHFCHVMNEETFADAEVQAVLANDFVVVREEADRRPDLVARWGLYGWPATIVLDENGEQLLALRGYRERSAFLGILRTLIDDRDAGRVPGSSLPAALRGGGSSGAFDGALEDLRTLAETQADAAYDVDDAGWGRTQRYPFGALVEAALLRAHVRGPEIWRARALASLDRYTTLLDPVWGGVYQYSVGGDWDHPHFEKLTDVQSGVLSSLAAALEATDDARWREAAEAILRYLGEHMRSDEGAFYVSQDADVRDGGPSIPGAAFYALDAAGRAALGREPRIDRHIDADVNGRLIAALTRYGFAAGDARALQWAETAADAVWASHCTDDAGCAHEVGDPRRHLADQAAMLAASVELYQARAAGEGARHLERAVSLAGFLRTHLRDTDGGLRASVPIDGEPDLTGAIRPFLPGAVAARALLMLDRLDEDAGHAQIARQALLALGDDLARQGRIVGELLLALDLAIEGTLRLTLVGEARDPRTIALAEAIARAGEPRRVLEQVLPSTSRYGDPGEPALFICGVASCSLPVTNPAGVIDALAGFSP
jgi:hypothetical protein